MIKTLTLENFAAFKKVEIDFSPKINVIIGENSCGKTQLLKAAYALTFVQNQIKNSDDASKEQVNDWMTDKLINLFKPANKKTGALCNKGAKQPTSVTLTNGLFEKFGFKISSNRASKSFTQGNIKKGTASGVFIPTKEVLSLHPALASQQVDDKSLKALFDNTITDLCHSLLTEAPDNFQEKIDNDPRFGTLLPALTQAINGQYQINGETQHFVEGAFENISTRRSESTQAKAYSDGSRLVFKKRNNSELATSMTAEGYRKVGILQRLIANGSIDLETQAPLFWDEPEANMNPALMKMLVNCLLELSRNGQQIILASHDYVLLKWFDLLVDREKGDNIKYHSFSRDENDEISLDTCNNYKQLDSNAIAKTYSNLYDAEIERSLGGKQ